jgi:nucleoside-diphosphate-sugar epimerase
MSWLHLPLYCGDSADASSIRSMVTILGAGGAIGNELLRELVGRGESVRLVSRKPKPVPGVAETVAADLSRLDDTLKAISGSGVAFLVAGLRYDVRVWRDLWPRIMRNSIEAAKRASCRLVFFDNVYMYGRVEGLMTEATPFQPCSEKARSVRRSPPAFWTK